MRSFIFIARAKQKANPSSASLQIILENIVIIKIGGGGVSVAHIMPLKMVDIYSLSADL